MCVLRMLPDMLIQTLVNRIWNCVLVVELNKRVFEFLAIDLIAEEPPKECTERVVCCDGGDSHLGHPKVYINLVSRLSVK